jgi:hypothetical protein
MRSTPRTKCWSAKALCANPENGLLREMNKDYLDLSQNLTLIIIACIDDYDQTRLAVARNRINLWPRKSFCDNSQFVAAIFQYMKDASNGKP